MNKVIVTTENYEEVMFNLLEDQYPKDVRENILDQIHADTFLTFEWNQWSKATYSESTEPYKIQEAAFIENLTREEKKKGLVYYMWPAAIAASILLLIGVFMLYPSGKIHDTSIVQTPASGKEKSTEQVNPSESHQTELVKKEETPASRNSKQGLKPGLIKVRETLPIIDNTGDTAVLVEVPKQPEPTVPAMQDTILRMIASAQKQSRYKITIVEEKAGRLDDIGIKADEKRYSMADVMNHKDGISLSKFLENPNSRIVTDKNTNKVTIEYIAEDHSILVLTLSN
jgi:hypothetical protein